MKRRRFEHPADVALRDIVLYLVAIMDCGDARARMSRCAWRLSHTPSTRGFVRRSPRQTRWPTIRPTGGDRLGATHCVDLRRASSRAAGLQPGYLRIQPLGHPSGVRRSWTAADGAVVHRIGQHRLYRAGLWQFAQIPRRVYLHEALADVMPQLPRHRLAIVTRQEAEHRRAFYTTERNHTSGHARRPLESPAEAPYRGAPNSESCFLISTLLLRALSRNQASKKTLGRCMSPLS